MFSWGVLRAMSTSVAIPSLVAETPRFLSSARMKRFNEEELDI